LFLLTALVFEHMLVALYLLTNHVSEHMLVTLYLLTALVFAECN